MSNPQSTNAHDAVERGKAHIGETHKKMSRLAQEFAQGDINRTQFQHLYDRYQRQIMTIAQLIAESDPSMWQEVIEDETDSTLLIKQSLSARIIGYSVYNNKSGMPIETEGDFSLEPELIVPMLSSYRSATAEIFQANVKSTQLENGRWLYFMGGEYSTLIILFSLEPASNQLPSIQQAHHDYEIMNEALLEKAHQTGQVAVPFYRLIKSTQLLSEKLANALPDDDAED